MKMTGDHRVTHGSFCTETSFYTEDIYIYLYIFIYIYIHPHTQTHTRVHTHTRTHAHKVFDRLFCVLVKIAGSQCRKPKKGLLLLTVSSLESLSKADTCVYLTSGTSSCLGQE